jgi:hypothetical protein
MLYLVKSGTTCEWQRLEEKWEVPIGPIALEPLLPRLGTPTRRRIVTRKINKALLEGGLPTTAPKKFYVADESHKPYVRSMIRKYMGAMGCTSAVLDRWLRSKIRIMVAKTDTLARRREDVKQSKGASWQDFERMPEAEMAKAAAGSDMVRIPGTSKLPVLKTPEETQMEYEKMVSSWGWSVRLPKKARFAGTHKIKNMEPPPVSLATPVSTSQEHKEFSAVFLQSAKDRSLVPEDKSPNETWARYRPFYVFALFRSALQAGWTRISDVTPAQADSSTRRFWLEKIPTRFRFMARTVKEWKKSTVPYVRWTQRRNARMLRGPPWTPQRKFRTPLPRCEEGGS